MRNWHRVDHGLGVWWQVIAGWRVQFGLKPIVSADGLYAPNLAGGGAPGQAIYQSDVHRGGIVLRGRRLSCGNRCHIHHRQPEPLTYHRLITSRVVRAVA
jgi:hypothetical protein